MKLRTTPHNRARTMLPLQWPCLILRLADLRRLVLLPWAAARLAAPRLVDAMSRVVILFSPLHAFADHGDRDGHDRYNQHEQDCLG